MKIYILSIALAFAWVTGASAQTKQMKSPATSETQKGPSDAEIVAGIGNELFYDRYFKPDSIKLESIDGIVNLSGQVDNLRSKERAVEIAENVRGVRSVIDRLKVHPAKRGDLDILKDVKSAFVLDAATESYEITPTVSSGVVTLKGTVDSWPEKATAAWVAKGVKGVVDVRNDIQVKMSKNRPAAEIANDVRARLRRNAWINSPISVEVVGDRAVLSGAVGSMAERRAAFESAWILGVNHVDMNGVRVDPALPAAPKKESTYLSAKEAEQAIEEALAWDPRVNVSNVDAIVSNGVARLEGVVDNLRAKRAAESNAKNTNGIFAVVNDIKVQTKQQRKDEDIATAVRHFLLIDPLVDRYEITTSVKDGVVTLRGTVDTLFEKYYAEDDASRVRGVKSVDNELKVKVQPSLPVANRSDKEILTDLSRSLRANPGLEKDDKVSFTVKDGKVTIDGKVTSYVEAMSIVNDAFQAGAKSVVNRLAGPAKKVNAVSFSVRPVEIYESYWVTELPWHREPGSDETVSGTTRSK